MKFELNFLPIICLGFEFNPFVSGLNSKECQVHPKARSAQSHQFNMSFVLLVPAMSLVILKLSFRFSQELETHQVMHFLISLHFPQLMIKYLGRHAIDLKCKAFQEV